MASEESVVARVRTALESIYDPCSLSAAMPVNIVDLGLVRSVTEDAEGNVEIGIGSTSPGCVLCPSVIWRGIEETVTAIPGVRSVHMSMDTDFVWTPANMNEEARKALDARRQAVIERWGFRPQQWKRSVANNSGGSQAQGQDGPKGADVRKSL